VTRAVIKAMIKILGVFTLLLPAIGWGQYPPGSNFPGYQQPSPGGFPGFQQPGAYPGFQQTPPAGYPGYQQPPAGSYSYRPQPSDNARGTPPATAPAVPPAAQVYGQPQRQGYANGMQPQLELVLSDTKPYVQENVILTLRAISSGNLKTFDPILPQNQSVSFQKIRKTTARTRVVRGRRQVVNELVYMLTPLRAGTLELPISANVTTANGYSQSMTVEAKEPVQLEVQPAQLGVTPWLPLEQLAITTNVGAPVEVEEGHPFTLVVKVAAAGTIGNQLPSLEKALQTPDFRIYREKTEMEGGLSQNGRHIMGTRTEHYTLMPHYSGKLRLPPAKVTWFNVKSGQVEQATLPIKTLEQAESSAESLFGDAAGLLPSLGPNTLYWLLPLLAVLMLLAGYWLGGRRKGGRRNGGRRHLPGLAFLIPLLQPLSDAVRSGFGGLRGHTGRAVARMSPMPYWNRVQVWAGNRLPTPVRFWYWVRCANDEKEPALWSKTLQFLSSHHLAISPYAPLPKFAERVIRFHRGSNPERMRQLFKELDGAIYGDESIDFERWKQEFSAQVRPNLFTFTAAADPTAPSKEKGLPELNPRAV